MEISLTESYCIFFKLDKMKTLFKHTGTHLKSSPVPKHASTPENME